MLKRIVQGVAGQPDVALSRVWLLRPGDICETCRMRPSCPDQSRCLHLVASAGTPRASPGEDWSRLDGDFRRFPLGVLKVGRVGASGSALVLNDPSAEGWARPEWVRREGIVSFAGQPLIFRGEILGVLAVFRRASILDDELRWLRTFADQAAVAIAKNPLLSLGKDRDARLIVDVPYLAARRTSGRSYTTAINAPWTGPPKGSLPSSYAGAIVCQ